MTTPPRTPELLLESLGATTQFREPLLGDLTEEFTARAEQDGHGAARRWYYREALRAAPHLLQNGIRGLRARDVRHIAGVVFASYCFVMMLAFFASMIGGAIMATGQIAPGRFAQPGDPLFYVGYAIGFGCAVTGGVIAAWLDRRMPLLSALALGVVWAGAGIAVTTIAGGADIGWLRAVAPLGIFIGTTIGGVLRVRAFAARRGVSPSA
jgi:hypothetical protein